MILTIEGNVIVGAFSHSPESFDITYVEDEVTQDNLVYVENASLPTGFRSNPLACYEFVNNEIVLKADWETIKAEREAEANNATLNANGVQVPKSVTARQARLALLGAGLLDQVESSLNALPPEEGQPALITWQYSNEIERANPLLETLGLALGLTDAQIDDLFISASQL